MNTTTTTILEQKKPIDFVARAMDMQDCFVIRPLSDQAYDYWTDVANEGQICAGHAGDDQAGDDFLVRFNHATWLAIDRRTLEELSDEFSIMPERGIVQPGPGVI